MRRPPRRGRNACNDSLGPEAELATVRSDHERVEARGSARELDDSGDGAVSCGALSGSGMASTQSLYGFFVEPAEKLGVDPKEVGAIVSIGAAAGRTMSPVAAVALMSARLAGTNPFQLMRQVAPPLLISMAIVISLRMLRVI